MAINIIGGVSGITVETDPTALKLTGGTLSGTVYLPTVRNLLNTDLDIVSYNDTGAGTTYTHSFKPYDGTFQLATNGGGLTYPDATTQTTAWIDAPSDGSEYVRKNAAWSVVTGDGVGLTISSLSNAAATTLNATAPTTGQALTFDGTELVWGTVGGGGGGATWGSITGTLSTQTDLQTVLDTKLQAKTVNTIGGGPAGVQLSDARKILYLASGGMGFQLSVDNDASTPYVDGTEITIVVDNPAFGYSVVAGPGPVTINGSASASLTGYVSNLVKVAANTWFVS